MSVVPCVVLCIPHSMSNIAEVSQNTPAVHNLHYTDSLCAPDYAMRIWTHHIALPWYEPDCTDSIEYVLPVASLACGVVTNPLALSAAGEASLPRVSPYCVPPCYVSPCCVCACCVPPCCVCTYCVHPCCVPPCRVCAWCVCACSACWSDAGTCFLALTSTTSSCRHHAAH